MTTATNQAYRVLLGAWIRFKDDRGESHLIAMLIITAVVAAAAVAFRSQLQGWFDHYSNDLGSPGGG